MSGNPLNYEELRGFRTEIMLLESGIRDVLYGRKVRFKALLLNGTQRTGTITDATSGPKSPESARIPRMGITIAVAIDRLDGRPGVLADTWYGDLLSVEVLDA